MATKQTLDIDYTKYNFRDSDESYEYKLPPGLTREVVERISKIKKEPDRMLQFRLRAYDHYVKRPLPTWGGDLTTLKFDEMLYYASSTEKKSRSWEDVPPYIKDTFDKLEVYLKPNENSSVALALSTNQKSYTTALEMTLQRMA